MPSFVLDHQPRFHDRYAGNVSSYQFIDAYRRPVFLERNIATVVKHHRRQTTAAKSNPSNMAPPGKLETSPGRALVAREWDPKEILKIIDECDWSEQDPHLRIDVKAIKDRRKTFKLTTPLTTPERPTKQARRETIRAICALTIWEGSGPEVLVQDQVRCSITPEPNLTTGERSAKVDLDEPLTVMPQSLAPKGQKGSTAIRYSMQITLQAASLRDRWPPVDLSNVPDPDLKHQETQDGVDIFPLFVVSYSRLPHVPTKEDEALWAITALQDYKSYLPKLSLQVDAKWVDTPTPLQYFNQKEKHKTTDLRKVREPADERPGLALPTHVNVETTWEIRDDQLTAHEVEAIRFVGYVCPLCNNRSFQGTDVYWFHLIHSHDHFKFRITTRFPETDDDEGLIRVRVRMSLKDRREKTPLDVWEKEAWDKGSKKDAKKEAWVLRTHKTFLDLDRYLKADEERQWNGRSQRELDSNRLAHYETSRLRFPPDLTKPAALVADIPAPRRKKYAVPKAPKGVTFFSLRVKRPLKQGEALSESDDDMDDEWAVQKHMERIDGFKAQTDEEKKFQKRHDKHMLKENINSNLHYRDALVRFCRKNKIWLQDPAMRFEFGKKLASLQLEKVVKIKQVFEYMQIIDAATGHTQLDEEDGEVKNDARRLRAQPGPLYASCSACSEAIRSVGNVLRCTNPVCTRDYHPECLKDIDRASKGDLTAWRCPHCAEESPWAMTVEGAGDSRTAPNNDPAMRPSPSPDLQILDNFGPDHLSSLPRGHGLGPGENSGRYRRNGQGTAANPISLEETSAGIRVQDSEADSEDLPTPDFPVGRDKMRRQLSAGKRDTHDRERARNAEYPVQPAGHHRHGRYLDPSDKRTDEEMRRRITDENYGDWLQKRRMTDGDPMSRPRRPHEL